MQTPT